MEPGRRYEIQIAGRHQTAGYCGGSCIFCYFNDADDLYHCVFFNTREDTAAINICVDEGEPYWECPVRLK